VTAAIVYYDGPVEQLSAAIDSLLAQTRPPNEILVIDNSPDGAIASQLDDCGGAVHAVASGTNLGYCAGVSRAAEMASSEYLLTLNPDARAEPSCLELLVATASADSKIAIVGPQILLEDGETTNAGDNPLHPTGISPAGRYRQPREHGSPRDVAVVSGACLLIRRSAFQAIGGYVDELFMYYDDVDLAWRARIAGMRVVFCPRAGVIHGYEFARRSQKWFFLERNRLFSVLANYERRTLLLLAPLLLATEAGLVVAATFGGWLGQKLRAYVSLARMRRRVAQQRRAVQAMRRQPDAELLVLFSDRLESPFLPRPALALANLVGVPYMRVVRRLLR
jgi:GT2 family glycosyltransferase